MGITNITISTKFMDYVSNTSQMVGFDVLSQDTKERIFDEFCTESNTTINCDNEKYESILLVSFSSKYPIWHNIGNMSWCEHLEAIAQYEKWPNRFKPE